MGFTVLADLLATGHGEVNEAAVGLVGLDECDELLSIA